MFARACLCQHARSHAHIVCGLLSNVAAQEAHKTNSHPLPRSALRALPLRWSKRWKLCLMVSWENLANVCVCAIRSTPACLLRLQMGEMNVRRKWRPTPAKWARGETLIWKTFQHFQSWNYMRARPLAKYDSEAISETSVQLLTAENKLWVICGISVKYYFTSTNLLTS
jgi:hypothetical protein